VFQARFTRCARHRWIDNDPEVAAMPDRRPSKRRRLTRSIASGIAVAALLGLGFAEPAGTSARAQSGRPNIIFVLTDDMSDYLLDYTDDIMRLTQNAVQFTHFFASNSLCCPSRATVFTGKYPHNTHVFGNSWPSGGFGRFIDDMPYSLAPYLKQVGYHTGLIGKFLNGYQAAGRHVGHGAPDYPPDFVPPGWDEWFVSGGGYRPFRWISVDSIDGDVRRLQAHGIAPANYLVDVMTDRASAFVDRAAESTAPFFLQITPFSVHTGLSDPEGRDGPAYPAAPRDRPDNPRRPAEWGPPEFEHGDCGALPRGGCLGVAFPNPIRAAEYDRKPANPPLWIQHERGLTPKLKRDLERRNLDRIRSMQSVDDLVSEVWAHVIAAGLADNTYLVVSTDNGYHLGEHGLYFGKSTAFDHDIRLPLLVVPPGAAAPRADSHIATTADLMPTFLDIAGAQVPADVDGTSLLPLIEGSPPPVWRSGAFLEYRDHKGKDIDFVDDPDAGERGATDPPSYHGLRTARYLYVDYSDLDRKPPKVNGGEFYDLAVDPHEMNNIYGSLPESFRLALNEATKAYAKCSGHGCIDASLQLPVYPPAP
jgi:arylsulfatase A-like enzyme